MWQKQCMTKLTGEEQKVFEVPELIHKMVEKGALGAKSGQGFYVKKGKEIYELNPEHVRVCATKEIKSSFHRNGKTTKGLA